MTADELKYVRNFCYCYPRWKNATVQAGISAVNYDGMPHGTNVSRPTESAVVSGLRDYAPHKCRIIEDAVREVDSGLYKWLLMGVTQKRMTYYALCTKHGMPVSARTYGRKRRQIYEKILEEI